jgi:hypothetical protein
VNNKFSIAGWWIPILEKPVKKSMILISALLDIGISILGKDENGHSLLHGVLESMFS